MQPRDSAQLKINKQFFKKVNKKIAYKWSNSGVVVLMTQYDLQVAEKHFIHYLKNSSTFKNITGKVFLKFSKEKGCCGLEDESLHTHLWFD